MGNVGLGFEWWAEWGGRPGMVDNELGLRGYCGGSRAWARSTGGMGLDFV